MYHRLVLGVALIMTLLCIDQCSKKSYSESVVRRLQDENRRREEAETAASATQPVSFEQVLKVSQQR